MSCSKCEKEPVNPCTDCKEEDKSKCGECAAYKDYINNPLVRHDSMCTFCGALTIYGKQFEQVEVEIVEEEIDEQA